MAIQLEVRRKKDGIVQGQLYFEAAKSGSIVIGGQRNPKTGKITWRLETPRGNASGYLDGFDMRLNDGSDFGTLDSPISLMMMLGDEVIWTKDGTDFACVVVKRNAFLLNTSRPDALIPRTVLA